MKVSLFPRVEYLLRKLGTASPISVYAKLLLAVLVLAGTVQAQSSTTDEFQYCGPGVVCPASKEPARTNPDTVRGQDDQIRSDTVQPKDRSRERKVPRRGRERSDLNEDLELLPLPPKEYSEFQHFVFSSIGRMLPMYGYDLFEDVPSTFAPVDRIPVAADYVIGPGDELVLRGWGQVEINVRAMVDRSGSIFIPKVGNVHVAGLRYHQLHDYLQSAIGRVFHNFELSVTLGELRSIQVFVVGHARRPGSYTVSSLSTLVNTLFASGGPAPTGSMRNIQLKRDNQVVTEFDLYDLLLNGDKSKDAILLPGDVIYVPPIGPQVAMAGSVNVPAIYELKGKTTLGDGLQLAGLLAATADGQKVTVERIENRTARKIEEFPLDEGGLARPLQDGDLVSVIALSPRFENAVTLRGNVARPGRYPWHAGMRVSDLIPNREMLITRRYWVGQNLAVEAGDEAAEQAREAALEDITPNPQTAGPGVYESLRRSRSNRATAKAEQMKAEKTRANKSKDDKSRTDNGKADQKQADVEESNIAKSEIDTNRNKEEEAGGETLMLAGVKQTTAEVNWDYAVVQRLNQEDLKPRLLTFNLAKAVLDHEEANNLLLEPGDVVNVFSHTDLTMPISKQTKFIGLEGEIKAGGFYQARPGDTLRDLVERAGGLTENAYLFGASFTRVSTQIEQQARLDAFLDEMDREVERAASTAATRGAASPDEAKVLEAKADAQRRLVARLRQVKAIGRVVLEIKPRDASVADLPDLPLEDGDHLVIPSRPATVNVIGAVYNENAHLYRPGKRISDYLRAAGGKKPQADGGHMFVIRADGSVIGRAANSGLWGAGFNSLRLMPGDAIVVPERLDKTDRGRALRDWAQVLSQIALSGAVFRSLTR
jgi:protein involved in polysaccharide export with SLBB domain